MAASLQAAATLMPAKIGGRASSARPSSHVARAFGVDAGARITCSLQSDIREVASKCADAAKMAGFALATSALLVSGASAEGAPKRLTFDEIQSKTYMEVKGTGTANQCPTIDGGVDSFPFKAGKYEMKKFCLEPTSFTVKAEGIQKNEPPAFQKTKLMTRLTYTFLVPSYRGSSFLDPKGRGGSTGYDNAVALPAGGRGDEEELAKENVKNASSSTGNITLSVTKSKPETGEVIGVFESVQPSDTDLGAKAPKDVKIQGVWYAQLESN
ncbi:unnamed protein product [Triticum turgidum subsp. durum]|uniref:Uncharacterized protein n=1 Tax=Triticum turgidum subsp. durum TaxID=4567 RepID=A0A9R1NSN1_TRITD|nr:unnamed protein product [Triticum turgidum subsp. durum]